MSIMNENETVVYSQSSTPAVLSQDQTQNDMELEPIDLEEVQKIQARMPAADPNAPIGSNKNPIRIIQQGNQYITTQDVSDEHLQQIIQVLTNQALISNSGSRPSAIYNRLTNRRIIFRVTRAKRRSDENNSTSVSGVDKNLVGIISKDTKRSVLKKRKRGSDNEDPDFEPEIPEEEVLPFPLSRRSAAAGRVSKPPKHLLKDYKHLRPEDLTVKHDTSDEDDHSDGGYSDYINDGLMSEENWSDDGAGDQFNCNICQKGFGTRAGLARHHTLTHGPNHNRPRGRWANPYMANVRRRAKLKEVLSEATDEDLVEFVAPRLAKLITPWDHLLLRSELGNPPLPQVPRLVSDYLCLTERVRAFLGDQLIPQPRRRGVQLSTNGKQTARDDDDEDDEENDEGNEEDTKAVIKVTTEDQSSALCLPTGNYVVQKPLREEYLPRRFRSVLIAERAAAFATPSSTASTTTAGPGNPTANRVAITSGLGASSSDHSNQTKRALVAMETVDDDAVGATLRQDVNTGSVVGGVGSGVIDNQQQAISAEGEGIVAIGDELVLLPDGGLGGPVPDAWLESGAFLAVLTETGQTSDLVMEAATGRLFHRPTGQLVSLSDGQAQQPSQQPDANGVIQATPSTATNAGAVTYGYEDEDDPHHVQQQQVIIDPNSKTQMGAGGEVVGQEGQDQLLAQMAGSSEVIDLNTLFPGVSVTEVSPGVCLVTKPNGERFNVEHGGEGITLETLQAILQM